MNITPVLLAIAAIIITADARAFVIVRSNDIELPASEKISKRSISEVVESEEEFLPKVPDAEQLTRAREHILRIEKRSVQDLYDNPDDIGFGYFRKGFGRERF